MEATIAGNNENTNAVPADSAISSYDLSKFQLTQILYNNTVRKSIALLGKFPDLSQSDDAIILFEKQAFKESDVQTKTKNDDKETKTEEDPKGDDKLATFFNDDLQVRMEFVNNIYGSFECVPGKKLNAVKTTVVYPATAKHVEKYSICQKYLIQETPELYKRITLPYITSSQFSLEWVYNILEHKQETERIVFEDNDPENGFILVPDLKWDGRNVETLYLLAIPHKRNVKSLRDLNETHLPLLRNIRKRTAEIIEERYGLMASQLRMYVHYQPSFYHFHVHVNPIRNDAPGIWCEKSHVLDTIINNLELMGDYYQRATLPFVLYEGSALLDLYEKETNVRKRRAKCIETETNDDDENGIAEKRARREEDSEIKTEQEVEH